MDERQFDRLTRRFVLGSLAAALGLGTTPIPDGATAKKRKKKRVKRNAFGCVNVGDVCQNAGQCCSGICQGRKRKQGKKRTKRCQAHDTAGCSLAQNSCEAGPFQCGSATENCLVTTGNASFCGAQIAGQCLDCTKDAECVARGYGQGAACVVCPSCAGLGLDTACVPAAA